MSSASVEYLDFASLSVGYFGERLLTEVEVGDLSVHLQPNTTYSTAEVRVTLKRRYAFHLTSTYLPTVLLILVGYGTLYIRLAMFQVRSIMSLTTLLVLTSLYTQTAASLPKTSYLKAIDMWLLYFIIVLVCVIITHIFTDFMEDMRSEAITVNPIGRPLKTVESCHWCPNYPIAKVALGAMRIVVPISFAIFNIFYWSFIKGII
ncbi:glycine receptor subunit alpha-2-like [Oratosquilla oratoria]|uniref:glycine receptor subunit alpha-2-like n=1 Tax=Oratosquilla oratoria TaxID=337810 RepID=UPI003F75B011